MEAILFEHVLGSEICPPGTKIKIQGPAEQITAFGYVDEDGALSGMTTWREVCDSAGFDSRQTANRLHFVPPDETQAIGMSAAMARVPHPILSELICQRERRGAKVPGYLAKLICGNRQHFRDSARGRHTLVRVGENEKYSRFFPDNHIYDKDHEMPKFKGGGDEMSNARAINLASHRIKSNLERFVKRKCLLLGGKKQKPAVRVNKRYWFRHTRPFKYTQF